MNFSVVLELATLFAFGVVLVGGRVQREGGWKMLVGLMATVVVCQVAAMGIVVSVFLSSFLAPSLLLPVLEKAANGFRHRPSSSTTTIASSSAGNWIKALSFAPSPGSSYYSIVSVSLLRQRSPRRKMTTKLFLIGCEDIL